MSRSHLQKLSLIIIVFLFLYLGSRFLVPVLLPFLLAGILALAADPLVVILHRRLHLPRTAASGIGILIALLLAVLLILTLCALLVRQLGSLAGILPDLESTALSGMQSVEGLMLNLASKTPDAVRPILTHSVEGFFSDSTKLLDQVTARVLALASGVVTRIPDSALGFGTWIIASFMISSRLPHIRRWINTKIPDRWRQQYLPAAARLKKNLFGWLFAQLKLTGVTFLILALGFFILRIPHSLLWAFLISLVDALPVLGTGTVLVPWSLICFLQGNPVQAVGLLGTYATAVILRSVLEPKLIGRQLGLDPLITLLSMYAGYRLWGILGMLFSPLLAVTFTQLAALPHWPQREN